MFYEPKTGDWNVRIKLCAIALMLPFTASAADIFDIKFTNYVVDGVHQSLIVKNGDKCLAVDVTDTARLDVFFPPDQTITIGELFARINNPDNQRELTEAEWALCYPDGSPYDRNWVAVSNTGYSLDADGVLVGTADTVTLGESCDPSPGSPKFPVGTNPDYMQMPLDRDATIYALCRSE